MDQSLTVSTRGPDGVEDDAGPETNQPRRQRAWRLPDWALGVLGVAGFAALLEVLPRVGVVSIKYFPPFSEMVAALGGLLGEGSFWGAVLDTLRGWGFGLAIALVAGIVLGFGIGSSKFLVAATASTIEFLRPIPSVALIPLAVLLFGTDLRSTLLLVVYASFWPILIQVLHGVQDVDPVARDTASSYRLSTWGVFRHVVWPTCLPYLMTGVRLSASVALILAVTAELIIGSPGLGSEIALAQSSNAIPEVYAIVITTGLLGIAVNTGVRAVERRVLGWHMSTRREAAV